jgi:tetratricopeptide (TPR) repeat protein
MSARYFNWKLAIVLVISLCVLGVGAFCLRQWRQTDRAERGLRLGNEAYQEHRWADATEHLGAYLAVEQKDVSALLKYADAHLKVRPAKRSNVRQAEGAYRTILRLDEGNSEAATRLTELYLGIGSFGEAELIAGRYIDITPDPELRRMLALAMIGQRKFEEAAAELRAIVQEDHGQVLAYETLGQLLEQRREDFNEDPAVWFDRAVQANPSSALAYVVRAGFHRRNEKIPEAMADLERARGCDLSDPNVRLRLARELIAMRRLEEAEDHLEMVRNIDAENQDLWKVWAGLALKSGSKEKMLNVAEAGLAELVFQPWDFMPMAAELYVLADRLEDANDCIVNLQKKGISRATVEFLKGLVAVESGQLFDAVKHWKESIKSGNKTTQVRLALASALSDLGDTKSAKQQLKTVVSEDPESTEGHLALARLLAKDGDWAMTLEHASAAKELSADNSAADLLKLRAQMHLLDMHSSDRDLAGVTTWRDIREQLSALEDKGEAVAEIKDIQFTLALQQRKFEEAESLIAELERAGLSKSRIALAEAQLLASQDKTDEAIFELHDAMEKFPTDTKLVEYAGVLLDRQGNHERCEKVLQDAMDRIDEPIALRRLGLMLAGFYASWDQDDKEFRLLTELEKRLPNDIPIKRRFLQCEQVTRDADIPQRIVDDIRLLEGEGGWQWRYEQARIWFASDDFKDRYTRVVSILQENIKANPDDQASRILLARAYERAGASKLAISTYREALNLSPDDLRVIIPTVAALYRAQQYDQAEAILSRASEQKLSHPVLRDFQLQDHLRRGQLDQASGVLEEILSNDPNNRNACLSLALLKMQQKEYGEASGLLDTLKQRDPNSLAVTAAQIQLCLSQDKPTDALRLSDQIVGRLGDASAYILRARTYASLGSFDSAREDLDRAVRNEPNELEVWVARSDFFRSRGSKDQAVADIKQALCLAPDDPGIQKRAISLLLMSGNPALVAEGRAVLREALESHPEDVDLHLYKARSLLIEGTDPSVEEAERLLDEITAQNPKISEAWLLLGEIAINQGQSDKAMNAALGGLVHRPTDKNLLLLKARAEAAGSPILAIPTLERLHDMAPEDVHVALLLSRTYRRAGEHNKAMALLRKQLRTDSESGHRRYAIEMAAALYENGSRQKADKEFQRLFKSEPNDPTPLLEYVQLLKEDRLWDRLSKEVIDWYRGHEKQSGTAVSVAADLLSIDDVQARKAAESIVRTILRDDPASTEAMVALAIMLQTTGRTAEAAIQYERVLGTDPNNLIAINNLAWIMSEDQGRPAEALELAQRGLAIAPDYFDLVDTRGIIYYRLGEFDRAVRDFKKCLEHGPGNTPPSVATRFYLARALYQLGQKEEALERVNEALDLQSDLGGLSETDRREARILLDKLNEGI